MDSLYCSHKQKGKWKTSCILFRSFDGWWETGRHEGGIDDSDFCSFFRRLSWKNCCIISAHSGPNTPRLMVIFGWNGWTGAAGLSIVSELFPPSAVGKSLQFISITFHTSLPRHLHRQVLIKDKTQLWGRESFLEWYYCRSLLPYYLNTIPLYISWPPIVSLTFSPST